MACTNEDKVFAVAYASAAFWCFCVLWHSFVLILLAKMDTTQPVRCDTALIRFLKGTSISFHYNSLVGDFLRAGATLILLKALWENNINLLENFMRYKFLEVFLLLILFASRCFRDESGVIVKTYYVMSLVLDIAVLYVTHDYYCEHLTSK
ncbi:uncharacterized protein LOC128867474 isoform X1 [Anastrepha ludens]|uniref:uncharacterized protein LOC128867474 isoform X1 n=1 Tax=Anastrepha ludens TaxID=28586 RepID=UPI0023B1E30A|nr:uncharacterized protein LOC128867474 isoform X1 [Anastrepha ludens]